MNNLPDIYPKIWQKELDIKNLDYLPFRNLLHFKNHVSKLTQKQNYICDVSYSQALKEFISGKSNFKEKDYISIKNTVRSNLHRRGLLTEECYENYKYTEDGIFIDLDVGKFSNGEPDCIISPSTQYIDFFYELYISISYPYYITNEFILENTNKLLATIEELQKQHINIKITLVFPDKYVDGESTLLSTIPLFSHKEYKDAKVMSSVINDRLLRKFFFAVLEDRYKENLDSQYGQVIQLSEVMNIGHEFDEIEFFTSVINKVKGND